jgi:hypothetical protein
MDDNEIRFEKYKFNVELFKWFIGSVVLVVATIIIDRGYRERTAGIQEMEVYDKYVNVILKADNIEERWKLTEYFSVVTPTERLRERWILYRDTIKVDYYRYRELKRKELELTNDTASNKEEIEKIQLEIRSLNHRLTKSGSNDITAAKLHESEGFSNLINKDVEGSINSFNASESSYNSYHQVYEIGRYLNSNKEKLKDKDSPFWKEAYTKILTDMSWKMPAEVKDKLTGLSN